MRIIATIRNKCVFERWGNDLVPSVVLSEERIGHIMERHPGAFEQYGAYASDTIEMPDFILEDPKNAYTAAFIPPYRAHKPERDRKTGHQRQRIEDNEFRNNTLPDE